MIEKNKKYTYKELIGIFNKAKFEVLEKQKKLVDEAVKENGEESEMFESMISMQNLIVIMLLEKTLFYDKN